MRDERTYPFSELVTKWLEKYIKQWKKIALLTTKKWFATWTICKDCGFVPRCTRCDIAVSIHKDDGWRRFWLCHICKTQYDYQSQCQSCGGHDTHTYGVGSQQLAEYILATYYIQPVLVDSTYANSPNKIKQLNEQLTTAQIVIGTSLLSVPPKDISFDLVIVMNADSSLHVPDFQSNRNCFNALYTSIQKHTAPIFLVQSYAPDHNALQYACQQDVSSMQTHELQWRKTNDYPPYTQMCVLLYKHEIEKRLYGSTNKLYQELLFLQEQYELKDIQIYTTPPLVYKVRWKYRYNIILKGPGLRQFMDVAYSKLRMRSRWFKIDWEPQKLL